MKRHLVIIQEMGLGNLLNGEVLIWVKKTKFNKTIACLFIYHELLTKRRVSKNYLERILEADSRITVYNYIQELKAFIANLGIYLDFIMDIYYDSKTGEYVLDLRKK